MSRVNARILNKVLTTDVDFTLPPNEDYELFEGWDETALAPGEIGINSFRSKAYMNTGTEIVTLSSDAIITLNGEDFINAESGEITDIELVDQDDVPIVPDSVVGNKITVSVGGGIDLDAQALITATGVTDTDVIDATDTLFKDLKAVGFYTRFKALYLRIGTTASQNKFNAVNPLDTDAAFRLTYSGGWTHSILGDEPNGVDAYADTHLVPSVEIASIDDYSFGVIVDSITTETAVEMGAINIYHNACLLSLGGYTYYSFSAGAYISDFGTPTIGMYVFNRLSSTNSQYYRDITKKVDTTDYNAGRGLVDRSMYISARNNNGTADQFSSKRQSISFISEGFTDDEVKVLYSIFKIFNTKLGR